MKIKKGFVLKEIAGSFVVVPVGDDLVDFSLMITTNETGAFIWNCLLEETDVKTVCEKLKTEYVGAADEELTDDINAFADLLFEHGILEK